MMQVENADRNRKEVLRTLPGRRIVLKVDGLLKEKLNMCVQVQVQANVNPVIRMNILIVMEM
jgi:hypothetical protein